jgi:hypothetical protein
VFVNVSGGQTSRVRRYRLDEVGEPTVHPREKSSLDEHTCEALAEFENECKRTRVRGVVSSLRSDKRRSRLLLEAPVRSYAMFDGFGDAMVLKESGLDGAQLALALGFPHPRPQCQLRVQGKRKVGYACSYLREKAT